MGIAARFRAWMEERADRRLLFEAAAFWKRAGALSPFAEAEEERFLRLKLEQFRGFASRRLVEEPTLTKDEIKQEWLDSVVLPMAKLETCREQAKALKAAVANMGSEMFTGEAAKLRDADRRETVDAAKSIARRMKCIQRSAALKN